MRGHSRLYISQTAYVIFSFPAWNLPVHGEQGLQLVGGYGGGAVELAERRELGQRLHRRERRGRG